MPTQQRRATSHCKTHRKAQERFADTTRGVEHRQTSLWQNRVEQHFSWWYIDCEKIIEANGFKRGYRLVNAVAGRATMSCVQKAFQDIANAIEQHGFGRMLVVQSLPDTTIEEQLFAFEA